MEFVSGPTRWGSHSRACKCSVDPNNVERTKLRDQKNVNEEDVDI
jgi:hypothetical protein